MGEYECEDCGYNWKPNPSSKCWGCYLIHIKKRRISVMERELNFAKKELEIIKELHKTGAFHGKTNRECRFMIEKRLEAEK